jgi:hypothetical protein
VEPPRRSFCGQACVHEWKIRRNPSYVRRCVLKRDDGRCAACGRDAIAEYHRLQWLQRTDPEAFEAEVALCKAVRNRHSLWDADHIRPVAEGGGECGLDNYRTLCVYCHQKITAAQCKARAARKREGTS